MPKGFKPIFSLSAMAAGVGLVISVFGGKPFSIVYLCLMALFLTAYGMYLVLLRRRLQHELDRLVDPEDWNKTMDETRRAASRAGIKTGYGVGLASLSFMFLHLFCELPILVSCLPSAIILLVLILYTIPERREMDRLALRHLPHLPDENDFN